MNTNLQQEFTVTFLVYFTSLQTFYVFVYNLRSFLLGAKNIVANLGYINRVYKYQKDDKGKIQ